MIFFKFINHIFLFLLIFLLGAQSTHAKTEVITQTYEQVFATVQPNIGFLKEKAEFVAVQLVFAQNSRFARSVDVASIIANENRIYIKLEESFNTHTAGEIFEVADYGKRIGTGEIFIENPALYKEAYGEAKNIVYIDDILVKEGEVFSYKSYAAVMTAEGSVYLRVLAEGGSVFNHVPTSGVMITSSAKQGTFLIGSYPTDLVHILDELNYPKINQIDLAFPVPQGQKFNLLNISDDLYQQYLNSGGGFFSQVNGPWIDAAVSQGREIIVVSDFQQLYNAAGELTGFGKEVHRLEWIHGYRFDPNTKMMIPQGQGTNSPTKTLQSDYTQN